MAAPGRYRSRFCTNLSLNQKLQQPVRRRDSADAIFVGIGKAVRVGAAGGHESIRLELMALEFNLVPLFLATDFQAAAAYELDNLAQFVAIEPGAVALANVHNHVGATGKVDSVHQLATLWARRIANLAGLAAHRNLMLRHRRGPTQHGRLFFLVGANLFEYRDFDPKPAASFALAHGLGANLDRSHVSLAARTLQNGQWRGRAFGRRCAAVRTELAADKHHAKTRRAGDGRQLRFAVAALRRVGRNRRATVGTVESLRLHLFQERTRLPCAGRNIITSTALITTKHSEQTRSSPGPQPYPARR